MFENIKPIDLKAQKRRRQAIAIIAFLLMLSGYLYYEFKNYPEEHRIKQFFTALELQDYQLAYQIWHPAPSYKFPDFEQDWGPHSENWPVKSFHITGSTERGSGVVVRLRVNGGQNLTLWVEKKDKSLSFPP